MAKETIVMLTADIVTAHIGHNAVASTDVPKLIQAVFTALVNLDAPAAVPEQKREPAVSVRASVKADALTCLECGAKFRMLKRHLNSSHNLSADDYRARWNLNAEYPLVAADTTTLRREVALKHGLGRNPEAGGKRTSGRKRRPVKKGS